jgi:hypothetical protein
MREVDRREPGEEHLPVFCGVLVHVGGRHRSLLTSAVPLVIVYRTFRIIIIVCGMEVGTPETPVAAALLTHHVVAHLILHLGEATLGALAHPVGTIVGKLRGDEVPKPRVSLSIVSSPLSVCLAGDPGVL